MKTLTDLLAELKVAEINAMEQGIIISIGDKKLVTICRMINSSANSFSAVIAGTSFDDPNSEMMYIANIVMEDNIEDLRLEGGSQRLVEGINKCLSGVNFEIRDHGFVGMKLRINKENGMMRFDYYISSKPFITFIPVDVEDKIKIDTSTFNLSNFVWSTYIVYRSNTFLVTCPLMHKWASLDSMFILHGLFPLVHKSLMKQINPPRIPK